MTQSSDEPALSEPALVLAGERNRLLWRADFALLAAAVNLARLAVLGLVRPGGTWAVRPT